jgi:hypothetical protein
MHRWIPVLAAAMAAGCGYSGNPLPPLANIPSKVADLTAIQRGNRIVARFMVPRVTTEGMTIKKDLKIDLRIGPAPEPFQEDLWAESATPVPAGLVEDGVATYEIPSAPWTGKQAVLGVRVAGSNGKESAWSNLAVVPVVAPLETPAAVRADNTAQGVRLTWQAAGTNFRIFRRSGSADFVSVADAPQPPWTDNTTEFGKTYVYRIQTIAKLGDNREAESEPSQEASITPEDKFPPAVPDGLRATAAANSVGLTWDSNTEADLAGYRVYRAATGGAFEKIADVSTLPTYSDHTAEQGKTYQYAVSSVDQSGNESARSAAVEATPE